MWKACCHADGCLPSPQGTFYGASTFKGGGLSAWDISEVTDMREMFHSAISFSPAA